MKKISLLFFLLLAMGDAFLPAQNLAGRWEGALSQEGQDEDFFLALDLEQNGDVFNGASLSRSPDGKAYARFEVTAVRDGDRLVLQEVRQIEPESPQWCLKYAGLSIARTEDGWRLTGPWQAEGCKPGTITLTKMDRREARTGEEELPFTITGEWTGYLSQSDRDYGFFYRFNLEADGAGHSYIVSEDNGGSARHALRWTFSEADSSLLVEESAVTEKTDPRWKWCIKTGRLQLRRDAHRYILEGSWEGFLEGKSPRTGACAPGGLYLEKPVRTRTIAVAEQQNDAYETESRRKVKIERVLEVSSPNLRIKVWDNGTVDGDVVTLFLNGEQLLRDYRVTKVKRGINVTLKADLNFLILHAEDLGEITPNTVAVSIDDGEKEHVLVLSSNLRESGAVMIKQFKL